MKNRILIIGANGFVGKNLVESFFLDTKLFLLSNKLSTLPKKFKNDILYQWIEGSLKDTKLIKDVIKKNNINIVIHLASSLVPSSDLNDFQKELDEVVLPTFLLLNYLSENNKKIVFFSSGGTIYGKTDSLLIDEKHKLNPISYYGYSKLIIENYIQFLYRAKNLSYLILRPSNIYGKYQKSYGSQGFIPIAIAKLLCGHPVHIWGDGNTIRDYVNVCDVALVTKKLIDKNINNEIINISSGVGTSLNEILDYLREIIPKEINALYQNKRIVDVDRVVLDNTKLKSLVIFSPLDLKVGIKEYVSHRGKDDEK